MAEDIKQEPTKRRVVAVLSAIYWRQGEDPVTGKTVRGPVVATHGEEIELTAGEVRRLESLNAILPEGAKPEDAFRVHEERLDAYRAQRGDQEALARHYARLEQSRGQGDVVNVDLDVASLTVGALADQLRDTKPNADDTVALAENDPGRAEKVLDAERIATGGSPRATVEQRLQKIIDG